MIDITNKKTPAFVILRREYLEITENFCAAKLIEYFKHWTNWKLKEHRTPWIYQPLKNIYAALMGEHSLHVIRGAITLLEELGIIERQKNPGNGQDKTWQYKLRFDVLNRLLEHRKRKTEDSECKNEHSEFNVESHHKINPNNSDPISSDPLSGDEEKEPDWEAIAAQTDLWEQEELSKLDVDEHACQPEQTPMSDNSNQDLDNSSAAPPSSPNKIPKPRTIKQLEELEVWEIAIGIPFPVFLNWRAEKKYKPQGGKWADDAHGNAYSEFYNNRQRTTAVLFPQFLEYLQTTAGNCNEQLLAGMKALLPSCFVTHPEATRENVQQMMHNLEQLVSKGVEVALPQGIATPSCNQSISFEQAQNRTIAPLPTPKLSPTASQHVEAIIRYLELGNEPAARAIALRHNIDIEQLAIFTTKDDSC